MRTIREDVQCSQFDLVYYFGLTEVPAGHHVDAVHYGEDGPGLGLVRDRSFNIEDQMWTGEGFQSWFYEELLDSMDA